LGVGGVGVRCATPKIWCGRCRCETCHFQNAGVGVGVGVGVIFTP